MIYHVYATGHVKRLIAEWDILRLGLNNLDARLNGFCILLKRLIGELHIQNGKRFQSHDPGEVPGGMNGEEAGPQGADADFQPVQVFFASQIRIKNLCHIRMLCEFIQHPRGTRGNILPIRRFSGLGCIPSVLSNRCPGISVLYRKVAILIAGPCLHIRRAASREILFTLVNFFVGGVGLSGDANAERSSFEF
ncbi:MAG TPA: hypothetical protein P5242_01525 [Sedimentisphaerales bacterium]|nr:hypothetical protein [Sedimentisphaerales bacterium]